jgi:hypothetical protein
MSVHLSMSALFCVHHICSLSLNSSPQFVLHLTFQRRFFSYANFSHEIAVREYRNAISDMAISLVRLLYSENCPSFRRNDISVGRLPII